MFTVLLCKQPTIRSVIDATEVRDWVGPTHLALVYQTLAYVA